MTEKRFTSDIHRIYCDKEQIACADTMGDAETIVDKLNNQEETINELKQRNKRQYNRLNELTELMYERQWGKLENMVDEWEKADELLQAEWRDY